MNILFTGGGSGGHFYPLIAIAEELNALLAKKNISEYHLYYMAPEPYEEGMLEENGIEYISVPAGKVRRYFSLMNILDMPKTALGFVKALWKLFSIYPDVVFAKGAYGSFPVLLAARILRIPVMIHESDSVPGRTNAWAGKFAARVAVSYKEAAEYFPEETTAYTGHPIRSTIGEPITEGSREFFKITESEDVPVILIIGGSQGAKNINSAIVNTLPKLLSEYVIIHQAGEDKLQEVSEVASVVLQKTEHASRYHVYGKLSSDELARAAGIASLVISRAGSTIFEIAHWGLPSIIVPITDSNGDHQLTNAYAYAQTGAASVIEEQNLTTNVLLTELDRIINDPERYQRMSKATEAFRNPDAAKIIATEMYRIFLSHTQ